MVTIIKYSEIYSEQVKNLSVEEAQLAYVGTIEWLFENKLDKWKFHLILKDETVVGFFNIDENYPNQYDFAGTDEVGLRGFFIDTRYQGKGYGKAAVVALDEYLSLHYGDRKSMILTVNCKNKLAYKAYLSGGFIDSGELYQGGPAGPQHVMRKFIK